MNASDDHRWSDDHRRRDGHRTARDRGHGGPGSARALALPARARAARLAAWLVGALSVSLFAAACDDAGTTARRALAERFVGRATGEAGAPAGPGRDALLGGRDWDVGLLAAARDGGGVRWDAQVEYRAIGPAGTARLDVRGRLDLRDDGAFRVEMSQRDEAPSARTGATGREALWLDRLLYTKLGNGAVFVRQSLDREHERWRAAPVEAAAGLLRVLAPFLAVAPVAGEPRHFHVTAATAPPASPATPEERTALRDRDDTWPLWFAALYGADEVSGDLWLREDGRAVERVTLHFAGKTRGEDAPVSLDVRVTAGLAPLPPEAARWSPPEDARTPVRERSHARLERILAPFREPTPATE